MKLGVPRQVDEARAAMTPAVAKKLVALGVEIMIESAAGLGAGYADSAYRDAGATVLATPAPAIWSESDVIVTLQPPTPAHAGAIKSGAVLIGMLAPLANPALMKLLAERGATSFSMEFIPRISRAQAMDVLSSQANLAGYKAVLLAAVHCPKIFPMMMTAAGTLSPARVLVIGAGVAGLQAIATSRRLGAIVEAYDVRPAVKEQVQSLGAKFVELPLQTQSAETSGGYARELTEGERQQQADLMGQHVIDADVVITTAAVFGKPPPLLIPHDVVAKMHRGSVIVDMAADPAIGRGNCQDTEPGAMLCTDHGVTIDGTLNLPGTLPVHASQVYANNMHALLKELIIEGKLKLNLEDEIQKGSLITHGGQIVHGPTLGRMTEAPPKDVRTG